MRWLLLCGLVVVAGCGKGKPTEPVERVLETRKYRLHYTEAVTREEAGRFLDLFSNSYFINDQCRLGSIDLVKGQYVVTVSLPGGRALDARREEDLRDFAKQVSRDCFGGSPTALRIQDQFGQDVKTVSHP